MISEQALICNKPECTFSQTGTCMYDRNPATCEDRLASLQENRSAESSSAIGQPIPAALETVSRFATSYTLDNSSVDRLTELRYCRSIGILGAPGAGKTACLVSLYLLLAHGNLERFKFRDSRTIRALEDIAQGARRWSLANAPEQLTAHTDISDERTAGFLHLRLHDQKSLQNFDLLLPDLPGEWTIALIEKNRTDRLMFLRSVEKICLFVSGDDLFVESQRKLTVHRLKVLMERLSAMLKDAMPPLLLVITHADKHELDEDCLKTVKEQAANLGFEFSSVAVASFSSNPSIASGHGIEALIASLIDRDGFNKEEFWPDEDVVQVHREYLAFGQR